ncbi:MAG: hypothetical protein COV67_08735 [Nitrospinae bacterium CG11_big_fil_rev_8_21_14_0_20_56_8]|nr:MAG: hypothetical protein COV67_08735 [Nitrospinae bacterium CG11_big_fil_rev_8_21_14_0_20_56_8]
MDCGAFALILQSHPAIAIGENRKSRPYLFVQMMAPEFNGSEQDNHKQNVKKYLAHVLTSSLGGC